LQRCQQHGPAGLRPVTLTQAVPPRRA
jgi:hypothetical protein